ncbi:MAG: tetratricopeptide repeat protein [Anaerolineae bacterium]|jgi:tetratricopeptide (TPR) repeat protein
MRHRLLGLLVLAILVGCAAPGPTASPLRLPTRAPVTPTPTPIGARVHYEAGLTYRGTGQPEEAVAAFTRAVTVDPDFAPAYVERGTLYLRQAEYDAALADAQAAVAADPDYARGHLLMGEVLRLGFKAHRQALTAYQRAITLEPALVEETFPARWRAARAAGRPDRMIALANEYLNAHTDDPLSAYYLGQALTARGSPDAAVETLVEELETTGGPAALWFALGQAYAARNAWAEARTSFEQARALAATRDASMTLVSDQPVADLFAALGEAYVYTGQCIDAQAMLNHALAVGGERPELHTLIGRALICQTPTPTPTPYPWMAE